MTGLHLFRGAAASGVRLQARALRISSSIAVSLVDIILDDLLELGCDIWPAQRHRLLAIDEDRRRRAFTRSRQRDADVGVLASPGPLTMQPMTARSGSPRRYAPTPIEAHRLMSLASS
jgi:hypothetical protein